MKVLCNHTVYLCSSKWKKFLFETVWSDSWKFNNVQALYFNHKIQSPLQIRLQPWFFIISWSFGVITVHENLNSLIEMLTEWLRNDATKENLKHWMWQMWHYLTQWCQIFSNNVSCDTHRFRFSSENQIQLFYLIICKWLDRLELTSWSGFDLLAILHSRLLILFYVPVGMLRVYLGINTKDLVQYQEYWVRKMVPGNEQHRRWWEMRSRETCE